MPGLCRWGMHAAAPSQKMSNNSHWLCRLKGSTQASCGRPWPPPGRVRQKLGSNWLQPGPRWRNLAFVVKNMKFEVASFP